MKKNNFTQIFKSPIFMVLVVSVIVFFSTRFAFKKKIDDLEEELKDPATTEDLTNFKKNNSAITHSIKAGNNQSLSDETYIQFADNLYRYLDSTNTDEEGVYRVFKYIKNDTDFMMLQKAFGRRKNSTIVSAFYEQYFTMKEFIARVMSYDEIKVLTNDLKSKGLTLDVYRITK